LFSGRRSTLKGLFDFGRKLIQSERLGDEGGARIENAVMHNGVSRVASRIENLETRLSGQGLGREFPTVHFRHHDVREKLGDARIGVNLPQRFAR
jgi:hypothetical protein